jgi:hypothetical protein
MPSHALIRWQTDRLPRIRLVDAQNAALAAHVPPDPQLVDENLRGYVMLLAAHFQGYCRDLHTECVQSAASAVPPAMRFMLQSVCQAARELDGKNAKYESIKADFERFDFSLTDALTVDPVLPAPVRSANAAHITRINHLNAWRNYAAHQNQFPPKAGGPLAFATVRDWLSACEGFASELDRVMYNELHRLTGAAPW